MPPVPSRCQVDRSSGLRESKGEGTQSWTPAARPPPHLSKGQLVLSKLD